MSIVIDLPIETEQAFLVQTNHNYQAVVTELINDYLDKKQREKKRQELLKNMHPDIEKWSGVFRKKDGSEYTDEDIDRIKHEYLMEKYGLSL